MLLPSPEHRRLYPHRESEQVAQKVLRSERLRTAGLKLASGALMASAFLGANVSIYASDVRANQALEAEADIEINYMGKALDPINNDKALFLLTGFNTMNADYLTQSIGKYVQSVADGKMYSGNYNNASLEPKMIGQKFIETIEASGDNVTDVRIVTESAGNGIGLQAAEYIQENSDLNIDLFVMIAGPDGVETLVPARQEEIALVKQLAWIPGITYSTPLRYLVEMGFRSENYDEGTLFERAKNFITTSDIAMKAIGSHALTSTQLMSEQALSVETANIEASISNLDGHMTMIYLAIDKDSVVRTQEASEAIRGYAEDNDIPYFKQTIPNAVHAMSGLSKKEYAEAFANIKDDVQQSIAMGHFLDGLMNENNLVSIDEDAQPNPVTDPLRAITKSVQPEEK